MLNVILHYFALCTSMYLYVILLSAVDAFYFVKAEMKLLKQADTPMHITLHLYQR